MLINKNIYQYLRRDRFGDNDQMADVLGLLVVKGIKTATCSPYRPDEASLKVGDRILIENSLGADLCVIEITEIRIVPFDQVDPEFAYDEGENDRSLQSWREEHSVYFERNGGYASNMLLICERFKLIKIFS